MRYLFLLVVLLVSFALGRYVHRRTVSSFNLTRHPALLLAGIFVLALALLVGSRVLRPGPDGAWEWVLAGSSAVIMAILTTAVFLLPGDLVAWGSRQWRKLRTRFRTSLTKTDQHQAEVDEATLEGVNLTPNLPRRDFLKASSKVAIGLGTSSSFYGTFIGRHDFSLEEVAIKLDRFPRALDGFTIAQLSDIHVGSFIGMQELRRAQEILRRMRPDLIVLTGDLVDHDPTYAPDLGRFVRSIAPLARQGLCAIPGNHDHYTGIDVVLSALRDAGAHVLLNDHLRAGDSSAQFVLAGVDDRWSPTGPDLQRALGHAPADLATVLLAHQPVFFEEASRAVDLQLSGHTHGGQVSLGRTPELNPAGWVLPNGWVRGRYDIRGTASAFQRDGRDGGVLYVNRGFGTAGPPTRIFSAPEVTKIVLSRA